MIEGDSLLISVFNNPAVGLSAYYESIMDEAVLAYYIAFLKHRRKPSYIVPAYYPLVLIGIYEDYSVVVDPYNLGETVITHKCIPMTEIAREVEEVLGNGKRGLADRLGLIEDIFKKYFKQRITNTYRLRGIVTDNSIINEVRELLTSSTLTKTPEDGIIVYAEERISGEELERIRTSIVNLLNHIEKELDMLYQLKIRLDEAYDEWRNSIDREFERKYGEVERSIEATKKAIEEKIYSLESRREAEVKIIQEKYRALQTAYMNRKVRLEDEARELEIRLENTRSPHLRVKYSETIKMIRDRINEIDKKLKSLRRNEEREINEVLKRYDKLIATEKRRLRHVEDEKKKLHRIHTSWLNKVNESLNKINKIMGKLERDLNNEKNMIEKILVMTPYPKVERVYVRSYIIGINDNKKTIFYPSRLEAGLRQDQFIMKTYENLVRKILKKRIEPVAKELKGRLIAKYNVIKDMEIDDIKSRLKRLMLKDEIFKGINIYLLEK